MRLRIGLLIVAVIAAIFGTLLIAVYIGSITSQISRGKEMVDVYVAAKPIPQNTPASELMTQGLIKKARIPRQYVANGAISSLSNLGAKVVTVRLNRGEQLTTSVLALPPSGLLIPKDRLAVTVPVNKTAMNNNAIGTGDYVSVFIVQTPSDGKNSVRIVLSRVLVLATQKSGKTSSGEQSNKLGLTLAVTPSDAEKLLYASNLPLDQGTMWIGLWPPGTKTLPQTQGQTLDTLF